MVQRVCPPPSGNKIITIAGRTYDGVSNAFLDVPDHDALILEANGWTAAAAGGSGATTSRPVKPTKGQTFFDSTLGYTIKYNGSAWINPASGAVI